MSDEETKPPRRHDDEQSVTRREFKEFMAQSVTRTEFLELQTQVASISSTLMELVAKLSPDGKNIPVQKPAADASGSSQGPPELSPHSVGYPASFPERMLKQISSLEKKYSPAPMLSGQKHSTPTDKTYKMPSELSEVSSDGDKGSEPRTVKCHY